MTTGEGKTNGNDRKDPAAENEKPGTPGSIGLAGGQSQEESGGLDISQYTGPDSKASTQFESAAEPYGTGPGSGIKEQEEASREPSEDA